MSSEFGPVSLATISSSRRRSDCASNGAGKVIAAAAAADRAMKSRLFIVFSPGWYNVRSSLLRTFGAAGEPLSPAPPGRDIARSSERVLLTEESLHLHAIDQL